MISFEHFLDTLLSTIRDVIPIAAIIFGFQLAVLRRPVNNLKKCCSVLRMSLLGYRYFYSVWRWHCFRWAKQWRCS